MQRERFTLDGSAVGIDYLFGIGAAGDVQYLPADVLLTASLVRQFAFAAEQSVPYHMECVAYLSVAVTGTVTTNFGITGGAAETRLTQTANVGPGSLGATASGAGAQTLTTTSYSSGAVRSLVAFGSVLKATAGGILFIDFSTAGTITLLAGSTFKVFRAR